MENESQWHKKNSGGLLKENFSDGLEMTTVVGLRQRTTVVGFRLRNTVLGIGWRTTVISVRWNTKAME